MMMITMMMESSLSFILLMFLYIYRIIDAIYQFYKLCVLEMPLLTGGHLLRSDYKGTGQAEVICRKA